MPASPSLGNDGGRPTTRAWLTVGLLWAVGWSNYLTRFMLSSMHGSVVKAIPMTETQFGLVFSVFLWIYAAANPVGGYLADRVGRSRVIVGSVLAWSALTWLTAYVTSFPQLLALRAAMGVAQACYLPSASALISDYHRGPTRSIATGLHMTGVTLGAATSGVGGWLAERQGWSYAFALIGAVSMAYAVALIFLLRDAPAEATSPGESAPATASGRPAGFFATVLALLRMPSFDLALVYWGLIGAVSWVITAWMPTYMQEHFHMAQGAAGFSANGYFFIVGLPGLLIGGAWADHWSRRNERARLYVPAIGLGLAVPTFFLAAHTSVFGLTALNLMAWGFGSSFAAANMMPILCLITDPRFRATAYGVLNAASAAVGGIAIYWGGSLRDSKIDLGPYLDVAALTVVFCIVLLLLVRTARPVPADSAR